MSIILQSGFSLASIPILFTLTRHLQITTNAKWQEKSNGGHLLFEITQVGTIDTDVLIRADCAYTGKQPSLNPFYLKTFLGRGGGKDFAEFIVIDADAGASYQWEWSIQADVKYTLARGNMADLRLNVYVI